MDIKLELEDRTIELEVNPLQASIIELFGQQGGLSPYVWRSSCCSCDRRPTDPFCVPATDTWNTVDLSKTLTVRDSTTVTNALNFWVNQGVLRSSKSNGTWILLERREEGGQAEVKMHGGAFSAAYLAFGLAC